MLSTPSAATSALRPVATNRRSPSTRDAAVDLDRDGGAVRAHARHLGRRAHRHALAFEDLGEQRARLRLLAGEEPVERLDDGDLDAEAPEDLPELEADGATTEHDDRRRQHRGLDRVAIRPVGHVVQTLDGRDRRVRAGGEHDRPAGFHDGVADLDPPRPREPSRAAQETSTLALEALDGCPVVPVVGRLADAAGHRLPRRLHRRRAGHPGTRRVSATRLAARIIILDGTQPQ